MNYEKIYYDLIFKAKIRKDTSEGYYEKHHIEPKCISNNNEQYNLVKLTAREHYIAHRLLPKFIDKKYKRQMLNALYCMSLDRDGHRNFTSRMFAICRKAKAEAMKGRFVSESTRNKLSKINKGRIASEDTRLRQSIKAKERVASNPDKHQEISIKGSLARQSLPESEKLKIYEKVSKSQTGNKSNQVFYDNLIKMDDMEFEEYLNIKKYSEKYQKYIIKLRTNLVQTSTTSKS